MLLPYQLWGRSGQVNMDKMLRQEAFVFYLKKRFTLAKKAFPRHRKEMGPEVSNGEGARGSVGADVHGRV